MVTGLTCLFYRLENCLLAKPRSALTSNPNDPAWNNRVGNRLELGLQSSSSTRIRSLSRMAEALSECPPYTQWFLLSVNRVVARL